MAECVRGLLAVGIRFLLWLRYRVDIQGADSLKDVKGALILPNHPGEMDPVMIMVLFWSRLRPHPLMVEDFYYMTGLHWLMKLVGAIPLPNMEGRMGSYKKLRMEHALDRVAECLEAGDNVLLYPSGRLMRDKVEDLRSTSAVYDLLQRRPNTPIVVVRTRGLLGSMYAWYMKQGRPDLGACLKQSLKYLLLNLGIFMPRRRVSVTVKAEAPDVLKGKDKMAVNQWLEGFYNEPGPEEPILVPYLFWKRSETLTLPDLQAKKETNHSLDDISQDVRDAVIRQIAEMAGKPEAEVQPTHHLARDLGLDSLDSGEVIGWLEEQYAVLDINVEDLQSVGDVMQAAAGAAVGEEHHIQPLQVPESWFDTGKTRPAITLPDPELTIQENFLQICDQAPELAALADETSGVLTYKRAKIGVLVLTEVIRKLEGRNIGVMLPASVGADLVIMASHVPGMLEHIFSSHGGYIAQHAKVSVFVVR